MEKKRKSKIQKWDEVGGNYEVEVDENVTDVDETAGGTPALVKNPLRSVEDAVEQNDNSLDGIINNLPEEKPVAQIKNEDVIEAEQKKKSILEKLRECGGEQEKPKQLPVGILDSERMRV